MDYGRLEPEASLETLPPYDKPSPTWPDKGGLEVDEVSFRYSDDLPLVLKSLSFSVKPSEKVHYNFLVKGPATCGVNN